MEIKDGFDFSSEDDNWAIGGLIGILIGLLGGPVGILFGSGLGISIGSFIDVDQDEDYHSILKSVSRDIKPNKSSVITIIDEENTKFTDKFLLDFNPDKIIRKSYINIQTDIYEHQDLEKKLAKEAKEKNY